MTESMKKAEYMARKAIESTYIGICDVIEYQSVINPNSKITKKSEVTVHSGIPCRLSYSKFNYMLPAVTSDTISTVSQPVKLFISPDIEIKPGSKIVVTQNGTEIAYKSSGVPNMYVSHQEISLELFKGWT